MDPIDRSQPQAMDIEPSPEPETGGHVHHGPEELVRRDEVQENQIAGECHQRTAPESPEAVRNVSLIVPFHRVTIPSLQRSSE